ncbi:hypothetical protein M1247_25025 [Mycobacterium sp. 21AC1]|uniref:hypothetical protein n=1 Tax=[Mycobacterium] appelbergii TaxID=2939269 RepID=UPI00293929CC|nr:hypothetical protein [Mycobacterium sp. 21AC1]MDV3128200.1 hypothetical protein [Mycobacterium sp. 21AC1]
MKLRYLALAGALTATAIGFAPLAAAEIVVQQNPGNAQIVATPGATARHAGQLQLPFGGATNALIFHN